MKTKIRLILVVILMSSFSKFSTIYAQGSKVESVIISVFFNNNNYTKYTLEVIKPDYSVEAKEYITNKNNANATLKKELDKWMEQGYQIKESTSSSLAGYSPASNLYVLVKEN